MERRKKPDFWVVASRIIAVAGWISLLSLQCLVWISRPEMSTGPVRYKHLAIREEWLQPTIEWIPRLLIICAVFTLFVIAVHPFRARRRTDSGQFHLWVMFILVLATTLLYFAKIH